MVYSERGRRHRDCRSELDAPSHINYVIATMLWLYQWFISHTVRTPTVQSCILPSQSCGYISG